MLRREWGAAEEQAPESAGPPPKKVAVRAADRAATDPAIGEGVPTRKEQPATPPRGNGTNNGSKSTAPVVADLLGASAGQTHSIAADGDRRAAPAVSPVDRSAMQGHVLVDKQAPLSVDEARVTLIELREEITGKHPDVPREQGLLRKNMLRLLLKHKVTTMRSFEEHIPERERLKVAAEHLVYLGQVFDTIARIR